MRDINRHAKLLPNNKLHFSTWGGTQEVFDVNVTKTLRLIQLLSPQTCQQVIYFLKTPSLSASRQQFAERSRGTREHYISSKNRLQVHSLSFDKCASNYGTLPDISIREETQKKQYLTYVHLVCLLSPNVLV